MIVLLGFLLWLSSYVLFNAAICWTMTAAAASSSSSSEDFIPYSIQTVHGLQIPRLGLGTAGLGKRGEQVVATALSIGIRLIDTAQAKEWYDEDQIGRGIQRYHERSKEQKAQGEDDNEPVVIVTKVHPRSFSLPKMTNAIMGSKRALYQNENAIIDVVLIHSPYCWPNHCTPEEQAISWKEGWRHMERLMTDGHIQAIGVSNFDENLLSELLRFSNTKISVIQNWMDPFHQDVAVRRMCEEHNIVYMAYSSFGTQFEGKFNGENPVFNDETLAEIAAKHQSTISAVVLSWLLQEGVVAIPRSSKEEHIVENAKPLTEGAAAGATTSSAKRSQFLRVFLDEEDMVKIRSLDGFHGTPWD